MAFFQLKHVPGYPWPALPDAAFAELWNAYLEMDETQWLSAAALAELQLRQVRTLLEHCIRHVPYYREVLGAAGTVPAAVQTLDDFRRVPLLPRRVYQERNADFLATQLPPGTVATEMRRTAGSSGTPTPVWTTKRTRLWWHACFLRDLEWCDLDPTGTLAVVRSTEATGAELQRLLQGMAHPAWTPGVEPLIETGPAHVMDIRQDPRVQLAWLRRVSPDFLLSYPANLEALARLLGADGPLPRLRGIQSISDTLTPDAQAVIEAAFGVPVKNTYSCTEAGYLASPCPAGHGLHVHAENVLLEVLDDAGQPCAPGQTGRVHLTHLHNLRAPLVRYELGDDATPGPAVCPCGRGLPLLERVQGKRYPMFDLPGGSRKHAFTLAVLLRRLGGHWQHQVIQQASNRVTVRLAVDATWSEQHATALRQVVAEFFEGPMQVELELRDRLDVPGSGKFQSMVNAIGGETG